MNLVTHSKSLSSRVLIGAVAALSMSVMAEGATRTKVTILTGSQAVPAAASPGSGCGRFEIDTTANTLNYRITFSGMIGAETVAHIHGVAGPGAAAGVLHALPAGNPKIGVWNYPEAMEADILAGNTYVNIHSSVFGGGELRGQIVDMVADINGAQEVPATPSLGTGFGLFNIDPCANTVDYYIVFAGFAETAAHIHGYTGHTASAGVVHPLPAGSPKVGTWAYPPGDEARILNGQTYVNIHSAAFGGGEIRGQITPIIAPLDGVQEVPAVASPGHGCGFVSIDTNLDRLTYYVNHQNLTGPATAAHIHGFAPVGVGAGVLHNFGPATPVVGQWLYAAGDEAGILADRTYFNVHTAMHGGGEVRGQIIFPQPPCVGDTDCNGSVDIDDIVNVVLDFGTNGAANGGDVNMSGFVDIDDIVAVVLNFGACP